MDDFNYRQIRNLIARKFESLRLDYRVDLDLSNDKHKQELIKDVSAQANTTHIDDTLVALGMRGDTGCIIIGATESGELYDITHLGLGDAKLQQIVNEHVVPTVQFSFISVDITDKNGRPVRIGAIVVPRSDRPPHRISKDYRGLKRGQWFVREGTNTREATDYDFEAMYAGRRPLVGDERISGDLTGTGSDLASLRRQLAEARENLRLIQERKSEYVLGTDIPLQLVKEERQLLERIQELEQRVERSEATSEQSPRPAIPPELPRRLKVFLCHASGDKPAVRDLYHRLRADGIDPWFAEENLLAGQDWQLEIPKAVRSSDAVIICLSSRAITKAGYVQKEIKYALDVADEQPEGAIFLIPLRLEECDVPERLRRPHWVDFFQERGYERLLRALRARAESLGLGTQPSGPAGDRWCNPRDGKEMVRVPAGKFLYGDDKREVELPEFWIDKAPVTNAEYAHFVAETGHEPPEHWKGRTPSQQIADHPVRFISWHDAAAYATWAGGRLPSEEEWEKAARGTDGREYPWGEWAQDHCNSMEAGIGDTTPVGQYSPQGDSPYGCVDMAGNVYEWTASDYEPSRGYRVARGGSWGPDRSCARCAFRLKGFPGYLFVLGFRMVVSRAPGETGKV